MYHDGLDGYIGIKLVLDEQEQDN
jgi:serine/threonine protein kinase